MSPWNSITRQRGASRKPPHISVITPIDSRAHAMKERRTYVTGESDSDAHPHRLSHRLYGLMRKDLQMLWAGGAMWTRQWRVAETGHRDATSDAFERASDQGGVDGHQIKIVSFHEWRELSEDDTPIPGDIFRKDGEFWMLCEHDLNDLMICVSNPVTSSVALEPDDIGSAYDIGAIIRNGGFEPAGFTSGDILWPRVR